MTEESGLLKLPSPAKNSSNKYMKAIRSCETTRAGITREERQQLAAVLVRLGNNLASVLAEEIETT